MKKNGPTPQLELSNTITITTYKFPTDTKKTGIFLTISSSRFLSVMILRKLIEFLQFGNKL